MALILKHLAVRVWLAFFFGALAALVLLPPFAGAVGPAWMIVPGAFLFIAAFWICGVIFAALGRHRLNRLIDEATVWERAGMDREARQALARAEATVDSFFFSPLSRRKPAARLLARVARFQLAFAAPDAASDNVVGAYLRHFPKDRDAAVKWLDRLLSGRLVTRKTHDIASRIGASHPEDAAVQRLLAQFYLNERRCDFTALQTYRQVIESGQSLPPKLIAGIADLFLTGQRADSLALAVYLARHEQGDPDPRLMPGIAGCVQLIHPSPMTLPLLERAGRALGDIDAHRCKALADTFLPDADAMDVLRPSRRPRRPGKPIGPAVSDAVGRTIGRLGALLGGVLRAAKAGGATAGRAIRGLGALLAAPRTRRIVKWAGLGVFVIAVGGLVVNTVSHLGGTDMAPVETAPEPVAVPVTDPFTLQVAAYLKVEDAKKFTTELKAQGLDAYWTRASGGSRTWYQVRLSHFRTKDAARAFGEDLKKRRIIDDFYVANYKRPDAP